MKFLVDENVRKSVVEYLRSLGYDVVAVAENQIGLEDKKVLEKANKERRILITNDKDFCDLIFYHSLKHQGVILFRLNDESRDNVIFILKKLLTIYKDKLPQNFIVITDDKVRIKHS